MTADVKTKPGFLRRRAARRDEHGAILILSAAGLVLAMIMAALAVDLGMLASEIRTDQKVADLAALDGVRVLPGNPTAIATESACGASRNKFPCGSPGFAVVVQWGPSADGPWSTDPGQLSAAKAVKVSATSPHKNFFPFVSPTSPSKTRSGVALISEIATFSLGSKLATVNTTDALLYNSVFSGLLGLPAVPAPAALNLTALGYQGLAGGTVSLADLVAADPSLGTVDQLATGSVSVKKLAQASLSALNNKAAGGDLAAAAAATALGSFATNIPAGLSVNMGGILQFDNPDDPAAAGAQINVFDLLSTAGQSAQIANGNNLILVPNLTLGIPGLTTSTLKLHLIEAPIIRSGPARVDATSPTGYATWGQTAQMGVELDTRMVVGVCAVLCVDLRQPITISAAKATGSLTAIRCGTVTNENDILVNTLGANASVAAASITVRTLLTNLTVPALGANVPIAGGTESKTFTGPPYPTAIQSTAANGLGLGTLLTAQVTGNAGLGALLSGVLGLLNPVTSALDNQLFKPLFDSLGLSISGADVRTLDVNCSNPVLAR